MDRTTRPTRNIRLKVRDSRPGEGDPAPAAEPLGPLPLPEDALPLASTLNPSALNPSALNPSALNPSAAQSAKPEDAPSKSRFRISTPLIVSFLMIAATVSWRHKVYYSGGLDPVVIFKALLSVLALVIAWHARQRCAQPRPMGTRYLWMLFAYLTVSMFGAWSIGDSLAAGVLAIRLVILAATAVMLVRTYAPEVVLRELFIAMLVIALTGAATGIATLSSGRLEGGIPPLNPNEIAMLLGPPAVGLLWLILTGRSKPQHAILLAGLLGVIWFTGSRTALLALMVAFAIMVFQTRQMKPAVAVILSTAVCCVIFVATATNVLTDFFARGGDSNITTLSSRTIAWTAAFTFPDTDWVRYMGAGLATKEIPVQGQYWDDQLLDSSWISAMVQVGYLGVLLLAVWSVSVIIASARCPREPRMLLMAVLVLLIIRSTLESGLLDSTPAFITFVIVSLLVDKTTRVSLSPHPVTGITDAWSGSDIGGQPRQPQGNIRS